MNSTFWQTTVGKTLKTALYIGLSAVVAYLITQADGNPQLWGPYTALVNVVLVAAKNLLDNETKNL